MSLSNAALLLGTEHLRPNKEPIKADPHYSKPSRLKTAAPSLVKQPYPFNKHLETRETTKDKSLPAAAPVASTCDTTLLPGAKATDPLIESVEFVYLPSNFQSANLHDINHAFNTVIDQPINQATLSEAQLDGMKETGLNFMAQSRQILLEPQSYSQEEIKRFAVTFEDVDPFHELSYELMGSEYLNFSASNWQESSTENIQFKETTALNPEALLKSEAEPKMHFYATALQEKPVGFPEIPRPLDPKYHQDFFALHQMDAPQNEGMIVAPFTTSSLTGSGLADQAPETSEILPLNLQAAGNSPSQDGASLSHENHQENRQENDQEDQMKEEVLRQPDINLPLEESQDTENNFAKTLSNNQVKPLFSESLTESLTTPKALSFERLDTLQMHMSTFDSHTRASSLTAVKAADMPSQGLYTQAPGAMQQVAFSIKTGLTEGKDRLTVQLKPESLGKIEVKIEVALDGRTSVVVATERAETYDLFRQDAKHLMSQLEEAGLDVNSGDISYNMLDQQSQEQAQEQTRRQQLNAALESKGDANLPEESELNRTVRHPVHLVTPRHNGTWDEIA